jgi:hypothetical protein
VSGAGPSVLALTVAGVHPGPEAVPPIAGGSPAGWRVRVLDVDRDGAAVDGASAGVRQLSGT